MNTEIVWLPLPHIIKAIKKNARLETAYVATDPKAVPLPHLSDDEAPVLFEIQVREGEPDRIFRRWDDRLWRALEAGGDPIRPAGLAAAVQESLAGAHRDRFNRRHIQPESPYADEWPGDKVPEPILLENTPLRQLIDTGGDMLARSFTHARDSLAVIEGIVHHVAPEPFIDVHDPAKGSSSFLRVETPTYASMNRCFEQRYRSGCGDEPWLEFRIDADEQAAALARAFGGQANCMFEKIEYCDEDFPSYGTFGCGATASLIERTDAIVALGRKTIGHFNDDAIHAYIDLRRTRVALGDDCRPKALRTLAPEAIAAVGQRIRALHKALSASKIQDKERFPSTQHSFVRATMIANWREEKFGAVDSDPCFDSF